MEPAGRAGAGNRRGSAPCPTPGIASGGLAVELVSGPQHAGDLIGALDDALSRAAEVGETHEDGVLPGLERLIAVFPGSALSLTSWATTPSADLDDATPAQALTRRDGLARVFEAVRALTPAAW